MSTATARTIAGPTPAPTSDPHGEPGALYRLSFDQYMQMGQVGILTKEDRVVLLDGLLVNKMTKYPPHVLSKKLVDAALRDRLPEGWHVAQEDPLALPGGADAADSAPEPDISVLRGSIRDYKEKTPGPGDVALVVEVADSSVRKDRKGLARYAHAGIPVVWIVNLQSRCVEVYTRPTGPSDDPRYTESATFGEGDSVVVVIDGREVGRVAVADFLP